MVYVWVLAAISKEGQGRNVKSLAGTDPMVFWGGATHFVESPRPFCQLHFNGEFIGFLIPLAHQGIDEKNDNQSDHRPFIPHDIGHEGPRSD